MRPQSMLVSLTSGMPAVMPLLALQSTLVSLASVTPVAICFWDLQRCLVLCLPVWGLQPMPAMPVPCCSQAWLMTVAIPVTMAVQRLSAQLLLTACLLSVKESLRLCLLWGRRACRPRCGPD